MLLPDEINFPRLPSLASHSLASPARQTTTTSPIPQIKTPQTTEKPAPPAFIWGPQPREDPQQIGETLTDKGKLKAKHSIPRIPDSAPITRQGYRSGCLAEDFWAALGVPNVPLSSRKTLQVVPLLTKHQLTEQAEYLTDTKSLPLSALAQVHIAELLVGVPWTASRARQHVVNEVSHALHKVLIFNNNLSNPFQKWNQGRWFAHWAQDNDGDHICTIFVSIAVTEDKVKPRKGQYFKWQPVPADIQDQITGHTPESIASVDTEFQSWYDMTGRHQWHMNKQGSSLHTAASNVETTLSSVANLALLHER